MIFKRNKNKALVNQVSNTASKKPSLLSEITDEQADALTLDEYNALKAKDKLRIIVAERGVRDWVSEIEYLYYDKTPSSTGAKWVPGMARAEDGIIRRGDKIRSQQSMMFTTKCRFNTDDRSQAVYTATFFATQSVFAEEKSELEAATREVVRV